MRDFSALCAAAFSAFDSGNLVSAESLYSEALRLVSPESEQSLSLQNGLAFTHALQGRFALATEGFRKLGDCAQRLGNLRWQAISLHQTGMVLRLAGDFDHALQMFLKEQSFRTEFLDDDFAGFSANRYELAEIYLATQQPETALVEAECALNFAQRAEDSMCLGCCHRVIGDIRAVQGETQRCLYHYSQAELSFEEAVDTIAAREIQARREAIHERQLDAGVDPSS